MKELINDKSKVCKASTGSHGTNREQKLRNFNDFNRTNKKHKIFFGNNLIDQMLKWIKNALNVRFSTNCPTFFTIIRTPFKYAFVLLLPIGTIVHSIILFFSYMYNIYKFKYV